MDYKPLNGIHIQASKSSKRQLSEAIALQSTQP